jgi:kinesin family protein 20/centromeric protein E
MKILTNRNFKILTDTLSVFKNKIKELSDEAEIKDAKIESMQKTYISMQKVKDREITRLQNEISNAKENNNKIIELEAKIVKLKKENSKISASKGGLTKENNKLRTKLDAKDRVIEEYQKALYQAEEKNQNQLNTIKELTKKIDHKSIEYKNNGLPKQSKKAFKKGNK